MKIAVPTKDNVVDEHFGHCKFYTIFTVDDSKQIKSSQIIPSPEGCGCKSNIAGILKEMGVTIMLAGNMGGGALNALNSYGIRVYRGCTGDVRELAEMFLQGNILDSGISCHHHEHHECSH